MKGLIRSLVNKTGFDIVRVRNSNDNLSKHLQNVLANKQVDCVIDVGANSGQYGHFLRKSGYTGYIVSFEPVKSVFRALKTNSDQDKRWFCHNFALGAEREEKSINVYGNTVFSSFLKANDYSKNIWPLLNNVAEEKVNIYRLDDLFDELIANLGCSNYMLKLDTQGYDRAVYKGAQNCLNAISVLQSEISLISVYDEMDGAYEVLKEF